MRTGRRRSSLVLAALLAALPAAATTGTYGPLPIHDDEQHLIESANDLADYFSAHALLYNDTQVLSLVRRIGHEIRPQPTDDYIEYEFYVLRDPSPNAFALPNGQVAYRGLGMVYEQQNRSSEAVQPYLTYARSATDAPDRPIVVAPIKALTAKIKESRDRS